MTYELRYGTLEVGEFDGRRRQDVYTDRKDGKKCVEPAFACGPDDKSTRHSYGEAYDPRCDCCWLGFTHTEDYHTAAVS